MDDKSEGYQYLPDVPDLSGPIFGPRLLTMIAWLKSVGHLSDSNLETWMEDVLGVPVREPCLGNSSGASSVVI